MEVAKIGKRGAGKFPRSLRTIWRVVVQSSKRGKAATKNSEQQPRNTRNTRKGAFCTRTKRAKSWGQNYGEETVGCVWAKIFAKMSDSDRLQCKGCRCRQSDFRGECGK